MSRTFRSLQLASALLALVVLTGCFDKEEEQKLPDSDPSVQAGGSPVNAAGPHEGCSIPRTTVDWEVDLNVKPTVTIAPIQYAQVAGQTAQNRFRYKCAICRDSGAPGVGFNTSDELLAHVGSTHPTGQATTGLRKSG